MSSKTHTPTIKVILLFAHLLLSTVSFKNLSFPSATLCYGHYPPTYKLGSITTNLNYEQTLNLTDVNVAKKSANEHIGVVKPGIERSSLDTTGEVRRQCPKYTQPITNR